MPEWWTYRPEDFLLFAPRVYWRMFELHNEAYWPLQGLFLAGLMGAVVLGFRRSALQSLWIGGLFALAWAFAGWFFLWQRYAGINWAAGYVAPLFGVQATLLLGAGCAGALTFVTKGRIFAASGFLALGGFFYPLLALLYGRPITLAEVFGLMPDPTAVATLGLAIAGSGRWTGVLLPIPVLWLLASAATLHTMGDDQFRVPLVAAIAAVFLFFLRLLFRPRAQERQP
ncbi:DUF6064 family protein [Rhizobiaceae bacterium n13]|uniref:DUF6064 family protein n=1 Tax=Ferirhizobium litorale TaxID=2927786 RepID=A0AAE3QHH3_9HYPH|nr:DUF6064 family protein [Fererhizobium litorale]MDI7863115.1 DUF6064 family protein [Fererhizobium litorale]MDI7923208.1 DUF6064 family protein [Fererhizobium litorale]